MINTKYEDLRIERIDSEEAFQAIENEWDALIDKSINSTFYSTYPFVFTAWKHFRSETDRLFILAVRRNGTLVGIAPFTIQSMKAANIRLLRVIRFIADWGGGDKPTIVTTEQPGLVWERIFEFLNEEFTQWDGIYLGEQPGDSLVLDSRLFQQNGVSPLVVSASNSFYVSLTGTWEEYLNSVGKNTLKRWKKDRKKLFTIYDEVTVQCIEEQVDLPDALKRFISIEQSGWKKHYDFSIGGNEKQRAFYEELISSLAYKKMVAFYFLKTGSTDIAGELLFKSKTTVYSAHVAFNPAYADCSPGILLSTETIKAYIGMNYKEFDFLTLPNDEKNDAKKNWSTGSRKTVSLLIGKRKLRMGLFILGLVNRLKTVVPHEQRDYGEHNVSSHLPWCISFLNSILDMQFLPLLTPLIFV